jgi:uncharacterized membrane protein
MTETVIPPPAPPPPTPPAPTPPPVASVPDDRTMALIVYILFLVPFAFGVTHIVGLVLAYVNRETAPDWLKNHYNYQIRTFWIGLLYFVCACISILLVIGVVLVPLVFIWYIVRCALGINHLMKNEPYPNPESWTF